MKNEIKTIITEEDIRKKIYLLDGKEVMLDSDLAKIYHVETKRINEAVNRNKLKFPQRISWILSDTELKDLWSQFATAKISTMSRSNPRVFAEQGIYMLATILKTKEATEVSLTIMDTFVKMRHYINYNKSFLPNRVLLLEDKVDKNTKRINQLFDMFDPKEIAKDYIFYKGELYDAHSVLLDIFNTATKEIILIDNYAGKELLDILRKIDKNFIIISKNIDNTLKEKYEKQYNNIKFIYNNGFHDRYIIIDKKDLYSSGASFKDIGKCCFSIHKIDNKDELDKMLDCLNLE